MEGKKLKKELEDMIPKLSKTWPIKTNHQMTKVLELTWTIKQMMKTLRIIIY